MEDIRIYRLDQVMVETRFAAALAVCLLGESGESDEGHAIELRLSSWFTDETAAMLADADVSVCVSDAPELPACREVTTELVYVRLHGHTRMYASSYR